MNKKIIVGSLGVLAIGAVAVFTQPTFLNLTSSALLEFDPPAPLEDTTGEMNVPAIIPRPYTNTKGKKIYPLITTDAEGKKIVTDVEVPFFYGSIPWPHNFPREVLDVTKEYYSSESVAVWAPWYKKSDPRRFKEELDSLVALVDKCEKTYGITAQELALKTAQKKVDADIAARQILIDKKALLETKTTERNNLQPEGWALARERDTGIPARIKEINTTITANEKAFPDSKTQAKVTAALKVNNGKISANQKIIDNNIAKLIPGQEKIINDITSKYGVVEMPPAIRTKLNTATKAKEKLLNQNIALLGNEPVTKAYSVIFKSVVSIKTLTDKNTAIQTTFDANTVLRTERDVTIPNRIKEINTRLLDSVVASDLRNAGLLYSEVFNLQTEIAKLPTLQQYDAMIDIGTRGKDGKGGTAAMQSKLMKALTDCGMTKNIPDKVGKMKMADAGVVIRVGTVYSNVFELLNSLKDDLFFEALAIDELDSIISQLTDMLSTGIDPSNNQILTPDQKNNGQQNLGNSKNAKDQKTSGVCCFCAYSDYAEDGSNTFKHSCSEKMEELRCTKKRTGYYKDFDYNKYVQDFPNICPAEKYSEVHFIVAEHGVKGGEEQTYCEMLPEQILDSYKDNTGVIPTSLGIEHTECNALNDLSEAQKYAQNLRKTLVERGYSDIEITIKGNQVNTILDKNGRHIPGCDPARATIKVCSKYVEKQLPACPDTGSACSLDDANTTVQCTENGSQTSRTCVSANPPLPNNFGVYQ